MFTRLDWLIRWLLGARMVFANALLAVCLTGCVKTSPTAERPAVVAQLASTIADPKAREQLKAVYEAAAKAVTYDGTLSAPRLRSTLDVAEYVQRLNQYRWTGPNVLATDQFSSALDSRWLAAFGQSDSELTPELRAKAVALLQGVADEL